MEFVTDTEHPVSIPCQKIQLDGLLHIPAGAKGMVIFVHGSGSSRFSPRNQFVARTLQEAKLATLLFDLLTPEEDETDNVTMQFRFDIDLLAERLLQTAKWVSEHPMLRDFSLGYFGSSTGGGAALVAAASKPSLIKAVVSRGGRPDLAADSLPHVKAATLLIVGGQDDEVIKLNQSALARLTCTKDLDIIPGATHLFEEPGKLAIVASKAAAWFVKYLK
ncbi:MAG: hydrolase [Gammaproteobacteria bacterium RIFCSPHIGHO2_12_FULL_43_28]|nr:MAG: hydrolase [Gammaproteobacteria bacterium RIFCSPHIGHO2_12_FULL_43_28]